MDLLQITALSTKTYIGVHAWEQRLLQSLLIDIRIQLDLKTCNNQLENTIDYDKLCQCVTTFVESNRFTLIETVAENIAQLIKTEFNVGKLTISVSKPHAIKNASQITVTINR
jgi:dihydroneopterin aldolase